MIENVPNSVPASHRGFLNRAVEGLRDDLRLVGVAIGGSYLTNSMDDYSDLDLVIAVEQRHYTEVLRDRRGIAESLGPLLAAFTGEHVGEPRLLICLYDEPLLHVDLKFVEITHFDERVENPAILWARDSRLAEALREGGPIYPPVDPQWVEDRFWVWIHYGAAKLGRGELFETLDVLAFLRARVLGPLAAARSGTRPAGVRRVETELPEFAAELRDAVARYDAKDCARAVSVCAALYRSLRPDGVKQASAAERSAMAFLSEVESRLA